MPRRNRRAGLKRLFPSWPLRRHPISRSERRFRSVSAQAGTLHRYRKCNEKTQRCLVPLPRLVRRRHTSRRRFCRVGERLAGAGHGGYFSVEPSTPSAPGPTMPIARVTGAGPGDTEGTAGDLCAFAVKGKPPPALKPDGAHRLTRTRQVAQASRRLAGMARPDIHPGWIEDGDLPHRRRPEPNRRAPSALFHPAIHRRRFVVPARFYPERLSMTRPRTTLPARRGS